MQMETLVDLFNAIASDPSARQRVVLQDGDREWTLAELDKETRKLAGIFVQKFGCQKGSVVAIYMNKTAEYVGRSQAGTFNGRLCRSSRTSPPCEQAPPTCRWTSPTRAAS